MADYVRKNAWGDNGTFNNPDLLWYAKGVRVMQSRALNEENSWWFFAAIHGEYLDGGRFPWAEIPSPPPVPRSPRPSQSVQEKYWNQCQHQSWYFPPWHRGYLIAIETHLRKEIIALGGPTDWALPYWNYLGPGNQNRMPPAFAEHTLPDGTSNPLFVEARYGPDQDRNIYIPEGDITNKCQDAEFYTGDGMDAGYGGFETGFWHGGKYSSGKLEANPHNLVHTLVGGSRGVMSYPGSAALDPIFYLHHCNIDRMWADWNADGNKNPTKLNWLNGPAAVGEREFVMPNPDKSPWVFTPREMTNMAELDYRYDEREATSVAKGFDAFTLRMNKLGIAVPEGDLPTMRSKIEKASEVVGVSKGKHQLVGNKLAVSVKMDTTSWKNVSKSLRSASLANIPDQVFLEIENVKGTEDGNILTISVNGKSAGKISLFGLLDASERDGHHGGSGLTFVVNITHIIDDLHLNNNLDVSSLDVDITPMRAINEEHTISIGRMSIHRE
ncbi:tyrosinase family protein [uncultured Dokdonia sp.]|uniref:tyrosinase family protein n=1 Tax=uncultured Dokdonia sp. TaxID=575653 RepID=UPI002613790B|nr:tyrosinase family protein [uncultured Dokdonia sp.]